MEESLTACQIWFQNRRQNSRRKSRPLEPHEVLSHLQSKPTTPGPSVEVFDSSAKAVSSDSAESGDHDTTYPSPPSNDGLTREASVQVLPISAPIVSTTAQFPSSSQASATSTRNSGYLANRRNAPSRSEAPPEPIPTPPATQVDEQPKPVVGTNPHLRLSMTFDGKAKVINSVEQSPSPPRTQPLPSLIAASVVPLRRSFSATGLSGKAADPAQANKLQRTSSGRSRDSRAWEFWCDSDARNSLTEKAELEQSGSAAGAIGLIRSNSKGVLRSNPTKRNAQLLKQRTAVLSKSDPLHKGQPQLLRASSSLGRLQGRTALSQTNSKTANQTTKKLGSETEEFEILNTDSDKENQEPEGQQNGSVPRRSQNSGTGNARRKVLGENPNVLAQDNRRNFYSACKTRPSFSGLSSSDSENLDPEDDPEIASFMGTSKGNSSRPRVSSGEELDCIQGLLAMSKADWR